MEEGRGDREYRNITHGAFGGPNRRGPEMGFVRPFVLSTYVWSQEPFVGRACEITLRLSNLSNLLVLATILSFDYNYVLKLFFQIHVFKGKA